MVLRQWRVPQFYLQHFVWIDIVSFYQKSYFLTCSQCHYMAWQIIRQNYNPNSSSTLNIYLSMQVLRQFGPYLLQQTQGLESYLNDPIPPVFSTHSIQILSSDNDKYSEAPSPTSATFIFLPTLRTKKFKSKLLAHLPNYSPSLFDLVAWAVRPPPSTYLIDSRLGQLFELPQHEVRMRKMDQIHKLRTLDRKLSSRIDNRDSVTLPEVTKGTADQGQRYIIKAATRQFFPGFAENFEENTGMRSVEERLLRKIVRPVDNNIACELAVEKAVELHAIVSEFLCEYQRRHDVQMTLSEIARAVCADEIVPKFGLNPQPKIINVGFEEQSFSDICRFFISGESKFNQELDSLLNLKRVQYSQRQLLCYFRQLFVEGFSNSARYFNLVEQQSIKISNQVFKSALVFGVFEHHIEVPEKLLRRRIASKRNNDNILISQNKPILHYDQTNQLRSVSSSENSSDGAESELKLRQQQQPLVKKYYFPSPYNQFRRPKIVPNNSFAEDMVRIQPKKAMNFNQQNEQAPQDWREDNLRDNLWQIQSSKIKRVSKNPSRSRRPEIFETQNRELRPLKTKLSKNKYVIMRPASSSNIQFQQQVVYNYIKYQDSMPKPSLKKFAEFPIPKRQQDLRAKQIDQRRSDKPYSSEQQNSQNFKQYQQLANKIIDIPSQSEDESISKIQVHPKIRQSKIPDSKLPYQLDSLVLEDRHTSYLMYYFGSIVQNELALRFLVDRIKTQVNQVRIILDFSNPTNQQKEKLKKCLKILDKLGAQASVVFDSLHSRKFNRQNPVSILVVKQLAETSLSNAIIAVISQNN